MRETLAKIERAWTGWLFVDGDLRTLAIFRMGWAVAMFAATWHEWTRLPLYAPDHYHVALIGGLPPMDAGGFDTILRLALAGCVMTLVGLLPRLGAAVVVAVHAYLFAYDLLLFRNHIYLGILFGLLLVLSPSDRALSLNAWARTLVKKPLPPLGSRATVQVIKAQVLIVYAWSAFNKLRPSFLDGWTLQQEIPYGLRESPISRWIHTESGALREPFAAWIQSETAMAAFSWAVVAIEAFLVFGLPQRRLRNYAIAMGLVLHGCILLLMNVVTFGLLMVSTYPLFVDRSAGQPRTK